MAKKENDFIALLALGVLAALDLSASPREADSTELGEIFTYGGNPQPPPVYNPTSPYSTVSDDERATTGSQQPAREFSIWDSVTKPVKKSNKKPAKKAVRKPVTHANVEAPVPYVSDTTPNNMPGGAPDNSHNQPSVDHSMLIVFGAAALGLVLVMRG